MTQKDKKSVKEIFVPAVPLSKFHCEIDGGKAGAFVILSGINSIRDFSDSEVLLRATGFFVKISGKSLALAVYENKTVEISGKIFGLELVYDKN